MIERTLILVKPDGVQRGLKVVGMKMVWVDEAFARKHYTEDITVRRGQHVRDKLLKFITKGPVVAAVVEGVGAVEVVRKIVGATEPRTAPPGTIRGDYAHHSYAYTDSKNMAVANLIHASAKPEEAKTEIDLWFSQKEIHSYKRADEAHHLGE